MPNPSLDKDPRNEARVLIIGGGLIGSSIAWRLAQQGIPVTVLDHGQRGGEASQAGAGMLSPGAETETASGGLELGAESQRLYPGFIAELRRETGLEIEFRPTGCLMFGETPRFAEQFLEPHRVAGLRVEPRGEGLFYPDDALVVPPQLLQAVRCAAAQRGVEFIKTQVDHIDAAQHPAVILAAGAWSSQIIIQYTGTQHTRTALELPASVPVKGHLLGFEMQPGMLPHFLRRGPIYVLQRANGLVVAGSNEERAGFDTAIDEGVCAHIHQQASALFPALAARQPDRRWIGFRPLRHTSHFAQEAAQPVPESGPPSAAAPLMQQVPATPVWLAYGHYRNGILLTPVTAARVAAQVADFLRRR